MNLYEYKLIQRIKVYSSFYLQLAFNYLRKLNILTEAYRCKFADKMTSTHKSQPGTDQNSKNENYLTTLHTFLESFKYSWN